MNRLGQLGYFLLPIVLAGVGNMILVKLPLLKGLQRPIDGGRVWRDGKRIFGDNKTIKGFVGMVVLTALWLLVFELLGKNLTWARELSLIDFGSYVTPISALGYGGLWGLAYVVAELPNSFIKRRLDIAPGKQGRGRTGILFTFIDQADSVVGCLLILPLLYRATLLDAVALFFLATAVHYAVNILLYFAKLKKQLG